MGFTPQRRRYVLDFTDTDLDGLVVKTRSVGIGTILDISTLAGLAEKGATASAADVSRLGELVPALAGVITEWNLADEDDVPVPLGEAALRALEPEHFMLILNAWLTAAGGVSAPLAGPSTDGGNSVAASLTMEPLSAPRAS